MSPLFVVVLCFVAFASSDFTPEREFEIKQGSVLNDGRTYTITEIGSSTKKNFGNSFSVKNDLFSLGKKMVLLDNNQPVYAIKHKLGHIYQKWKVYDAKTDEAIGTLKHRPSLLRDSFKFKSTKFGNYRITGQLGDRTFVIKKDGHQVAKIQKKLFHIHDNYVVQIEANQDPALILLLTIGIDEIREH